MSLVYSYLCIKCSSSKRIKWLTLTICKWINSKSSFTLERICKQSKLKRENKKKKKLIFTLPEPLKGSSPAKGSEGNSFELKPLFCCSASIKGGVIVRGNKLLIFMISFDDIETSNSVIPSFNRLSYSSNSISFVLIWLISSWVSPTFFAVNSVSFLQASNLASSWDSSPFNSSSSFRLATNSPSCWPTFNFCSSNCLLNWST